MSALGVKIGPLVMNSPIVMAGGIFSYGEVNIDFVNYKKLGAIVTKTVSLKPRKGNPQPRIWETSSGMINSVGLQNPGIKDFIKNTLPSIKRDGVKVIISIMGEDEEEISRITRILMGEKNSYNAIELNLSCPNVNRDEIMTSQSPEMTSKFVKSVKRVCGDMPLIVKLSPNVTDIVEIAASAEEAGADALSMINTVKALSVDFKNNRIIEGGLSGPSVKHIGLKAVYDVYKKSGIPIIGIGGITSGKDALEYIAVGASAVGLGSGFFSNPLLIDEVYDTLSRFLRENRFKTLADITGLLNEKKKQGQNMGRNFRGKRY